MATGSFLGIFVPALTATGLAVGGLAAALLASPPPGPVVALFPPWWSSAHVMKAAAGGGRVLRLGLMESVVLIAPEGPDGRDKLWRAGAWLLLAPNGLAGCGLTNGASSDEI
jgi:hypothetical protein